MSADDELYFTFDLGENNSIDADFDLEENNSIDANFNIYAAGTTWGSITGNLEEQTDLSDILNTFNGQITSNHNEITSLSNTIQTYGDIVSYDAADFATSNQGMLASTALQPGDNITRLTNNARYITASALNGYATEAWVNNKGYITGITSNDVTNALGYTPYNNTNPRGFITRADLPTLEDLTTTVQLNAINSGATTALINQITTNKNAITSETTNRQNADNNLQSQIDAITAASDVTDIVGTYAQLQAYDTSSLPPNSIIKVLQDESRNNETTYYRWVITGGVGSWVLIGEEGPYYTKSESDSIFVPQTRTINGQSLSNNITLAIPTDTSELTNGAGYITDSALNGYATQNWVGQQGYLTAITSSDVTNALGYTPYNSTNPNGYTSNVGTVTSVNNVQPDSSGNVAITVSSIPPIGYGTSNTAAATVTKEVSIPEITELNVGQIIVVNPTVTSTVANMKLKLNNFEAFTILYGGVATTTTTDVIVWSSYVPSMFVYDRSSDGTTYYWRFVCHGQDLNTTYTINYLIDAGQYTAGSGAYAITRYSLIMQKPDMTWEKVTATNASYSTSTTKNVNTNGFLLDSGVKYYNTTANVANGALTTANVVRPQSSPVDMRYSTNCGSTPPWAVGDYIYLVGTMGADGLFYLDATTWWTNTLPSTADGKLYIQLGHVVSTYSISLYANQPVLYNDGTGIKEYVRGGGSVYTEGTGIDITNDTISVDTSVVATQTDISDMATQTWVGQQGYLTAITSSDVTNALGYTPYNSTNPNGYISGITSSDVTTALGYTPVNKAGDTMTGALLLDGTNSNFQKKDTFPTSTPNENTYIHGLEIFGNDTKVGVVGIGYLTNGNLVTRIQTQREVSGTTKYSTFNIGVSSSGNTYCTFPNTICCDGQWVTTDIDVALNYSLAPQAEQSWTLSNIPNDGNKYEVQGTITASGTKIAVVLRSSLINKPNRIITTNDSSCVFIFPINSDRQIRLANWGSDTANITFFRIYGYRRIGTNE